MIDGEWSSEDALARIEQGRYIRRESQFRHWITPDGKPGPSGEGGFAADSDRYHLYVSHACPWAHRTMMMRALKGLENIISVSVVHWFMGEHGWSFAQGDGVVGDPFGASRYLYEVYARANPRYCGRVTVPVLWDRRKRTIVNNESSEIIVMLNSAFDGVGAKNGDYYPEALRDQIDALNATIYRNVNNGVYRAGFATTQEAYDEAVGELFTTLDMLESRLANRRYLFGDQLTLADIRLLPTLLRFDAVYVGHFKCNVRRIVDYPNLWGYTRDLLQRPEISSTFHIDHVRRHYYSSHRHINPFGVVPAGPIIDFTAPHDRARLDNS